MNLAKQIVGATRDGDTDGELHVPGILTPTFTLSEPLRRPLMFFPPVPVAQGGIQDTFTVIDALTQIGLNAGGQIIQWGVLAPGIWRLTFTEEYVFTGTASTNADFVQLLPQDSGAAQYQPINHWHQVGVRAPAPTIIELVLDKPLTMTVVTGPTVAGDTLLWNLAMLAQRLF